MLKKRLEGDVVENEDGKIRGNGVFEGGRGIDQENVVELLAT